MTLHNYKIRDYQEKIFNICRDQSSIIYLPTGSGKTLISIKVIDSFRNLITKDLKEGGKRAAFLVNTVCLAQQQKDVIKELLDVEVGCWTSETKKKSWHKEKYQEEFNKSAVIVATAQLLVDAVKHSFISIDQLCVVVFDECHHGRQNHPYHEFMKQFQYVNPDSHPRIIGLSAQLVGIANTLTVDNLNDELKALESTFRAKIVTVNKMQDYKNVLLYSTDPNEMFIRYPNFSNCDLAEDLREHIDKIRWTLSTIKVPSMTEIKPSSLTPSRSRKLKELELFFEEVKEEMKQIGLIGAYLALKAIRVQYELIKKKPSQKPQFLAVVNKCLEYVNQLIALMNDERDFEKWSSREEFLQFTSPKARNLISLLKLKFNNPKDKMNNLQCLLFVTRRYTAKCLYHLLKLYAQCDNEFPINPDFIVGINGEIPESIEDVLSQNSNSMALDRFRRKETNLICTSSVLEEGMDLTTCNFVIMFDYPTTFRAYLQTMGRARMKNSEYIVLLENSKVEGYLKSRENMHEIKKKLINILITTKTVDRELSQEDIEKEQTEAWQPLITEKNALVNSISSIALLNRFISPFTNANLLWSRRDLGRGKIIAIITLPRNLSLEKYVIESRPCIDIKTAKQHAAFLACELLYEKGYLDSHLIPNISA